MSQNSKKIALRATITYLLSTGIIMWKHCRKLTVRLRQNMKKGQRILESRIYFDNVDINLCPALKYCNYWVVYYRIPCKHKKYMGKIHPIVGGGWSKLDFFPVLPKVSTVFAQVWSKNNNSLRVALYIKNKLVSVLNYIAKLCTLLPSLEKDDLEVLCTRMKV